MEYPNNDYTPQYNQYNQYAFQQQQQPMPFAQQYPQYSYPYTYDPYCSYGYPPQTQQSTLPHPQRTTNDVPIKKTNPIPIKDPKTKEEINPLDVKKKNTQIDEAKPDVSYPSNLKLNLQTNSTKVGQLKEDSPSRVPYFKKQSASLKTQNFPKETQDNHRDHALNQHLKTKEPEELNEYVEDDYQSSGSQMEEDEENASTQNEVDYSPGSEADIALNAGSRRVYPRDLLLRIGEQLLKSSPPEELKKCEVFTPYAKEQTQNRKLGTQSNKYPRKSGTPTKSMGNSCFDGFDGIRGKMGNRPIGQNVNPKQAFSHLQHRSENAFNVTNVSSLAEEEKVLKKVRGILNRITPNSYSALFSLLWEEMQVGVSDVMGLVERVIDIVFDVALDQANYSKLYATICYNLCRKIQTLKESEKKAEEEKVDPNSTLTEFRRILLNKCQQRFEEGSAHKPAIIPEFATEEEKASIAKSEALFRRRSLGNIRFISELFIRSLLSERIMHIVIKILLLDTDHTDPSHADMLEVLCLMLTTVGKKLDRPQAKSHFDHYFAQLTNLSQAYSITRIRFLIMNVLELRECGWVSRFDKMDEAPTCVEAKNVVVARTQSWNNPELQRKTSPKFPIDRTHSYNSATDQQNVKKSTAKVPAWAPVCKSTSQEIPTTPTTLTPVSIPNSPFTPLTSGFEKPQQVEVHEPKDNVVDTKSINLVKLWLESKDEKAALEFLSTEVPSEEHKKLVENMILFTIGENKLEAERESIPSLLLVFEQNGAIASPVFHQAFIGVMERAIQREMWVDVPKVWRNLGNVISGNINVSMIDYEVLHSMSELLMKDDEYFAETENFLRNIAECIKYKGFALNSEKAWNLIISVQKAFGIKPKKYKQPKPFGVDEFINAISKLPKKKVTEDA